MNARTTFDTRIQLDDDALENMKTNRFGCSPVACVQAFKGKGYVGNCFCKGPYANYAVWCALCDSHDGGRFGCRKKTFLAGMVALISADSFH